MGGEFLLKIWVNALKDFHYDVEDLLDEYSIETPQCRWSTECQESTAEVRKLVSCCYIELDPSLVMFRSRLQKLVLLMAETVVVLKGFAANGKHNLSTIFSLTKCQLHTFIFRCSSKFLLPEIRCH
ncbi:hypothetical protein POUND7_011487 [Theobroma cacao]